MSTDLVWSGNNRNMGPFHSREGWYFDRDRDGQVLIQHRVTTDEDGYRLSEGSWRVDASVILDPDTWASVVAFVSASGDTGDAFFAAAAFHVGGLHRTGAALEAWGRRLGKPAAPEGENP